MLKINSTVQVQGVVQEAFSNFCWSQREDPLLSPASSTWRCRRRSTQGSSCMDLVSCSVTFEIVKTYSESRAISLCLHMKYDYTKYKLWFGQKDESLTLFSAMFLCLDHKLSDSARGEHLATMPCTLSPGIRRDGGMSSCLNRKLLRGITEENYSGLLASLLSYFPDRFLLMW